MPLTSDQFVGALNTLLRQPSGSGAEQRREPRVSVSGVVLLTAEDSDEPPIHAHLKDLSRGGVGFTHHAGLAKGRRLRLHLPSAEGEPHTVRCEVRHCSLVRDGLYLIGVVFLDDDAGPTTA
jgi:PilZ domain